MRGPDILIVGGGIAGLATALYLAPMPVTLIEKAPLGEGGSTPWAQGGIAAAVAADDDPALHAEDTLAAAAGLGDPSLIERVTAAGPQAIADLARWGVCFDRDRAGALRPGLEAAHSRRRVVHAGRDGSGREIARALAAAVRATRSIRALDGAVAEDLLLEDGVVRGIAVRHGARRLMLPARAVVLATGGIGQVYRSTTNPAGQRGEGLVMAARAGARLADLEFVQFHPTAIDVGCDPMPLATEALRGEGAILVNDRGERFMAGQGAAELSPRDIVARAVWRELARGRQVFLDARASVGQRFPERFPSVYALCRAAGVDPVAEPIPIRPAAHYHMGGVAVDARGRTSLPGLWACGEAACSGLHGANRLASNSLLEGVVFARWIAADIAGLGSAASPHTIGRAPRDAAAPPPPLDTRTNATIRAVMDDAVGVVRDGDGLGRAIARLERWAAAPAPTPQSTLATVGLLVATAAWLRRESRGGHFRADHPNPMPACQKRSQLTLAEARGIARELGDTPQRRIVAA